MTKKKYACPLPFNHMAIRPDGRVLPCCIYRWADVPSDLNIFHNDPLNHPYMKDLREQMRSDAPVSGCSYCYKDEALNGQSMRTEMWDESKKYGLSSLENNTPPELTYLDLSISNTCNNKCRMCMPELSTSWYADAKQLGLEIPKGIITNPLIENGDFSKLKYLKLLGGEPLLEQDKLIKILKQCDLPNLRINLITNTTVIPTKELHNLFTQCKKVSVSLSMDATGALNEFLRKGSEWAKTVETVDWFISNNYDLNVHSVASIYNVNVLDQLNKFCQRKKLIQKCVLVDGPEYMMPRNLPVQVKEKLKKRLEKDKNDAIINTVIKELSTPGNFDVFVENDNKMNELRNEHWKHANPELYKLLTGYL